MLSAMLMAWTVLATAAEPSSKLDPLSEAEIRAAVETLKKEGKADGETLYPLMTLQEPAKGAKAPPREAFAVLYDRKTSKTAEAVIDLAARKVSAWKELPGIQPPVMLSEFEQFPAVVKEDARFKKAMAARGITDLEQVAVDIWGYGTPAEGDAGGRRLLRALPYFKGTGKNFYARPIEGLTIVVDASARRVDKLIDTGAVVIPPQASELDAASLPPARPKLKPLEILQEKGPSFESKGWTISWDGWTFHFSMHPREGLLIQDARFRGRLVLSRASLSEMMVPYGHPDANWHYRAAFDEGEYGIGRYSGSLARGVDVPSNARLYDAVFADDRGKPYTVKDAVAVYERDGGLLWKHFDMYHGGNYSRRGRDLVVGFVTTISNYDYGMNWIFRQDGSLEMEAQLTGIMLAKGSAMTKMEHGKSSDDMRYAHIVAPNVVAPHHQHFFTFRLDLDIEDAGNDRVVELEARPLPVGPANPFANAFAMEEKVLSTETQARRDLNMHLQRKWKVEDSSRRNSLGYHPGYVLIPGENSVPLLAGSSPLRRRGGFIEHHFWATPYSPDELYAAGTYPSQRASSDGLPDWTAKDRLIEDQDVVVWYNFGITHAPRPEEWPVMPVHRAGFRLLPIGFFERNPALDVP